MAITTDTRVRQIFQRRGEINQIHHAAPKMLSSTESPSHGHVSIQREGSQPLPAAMNCIQVRKPRIALPKQKISNDHARRTTGLRPARLNSRIAYIANASDMKSDMKNHMPPPTSLTAMSHELYILMVFLVTSHSKHEDIQSIILFLLPPLGYYLLQARMRFSCHRGVLARSAAHERCSRAELLLSLPNLPLKTVIVIDARNTYGWLISKHLPRMAKFVTPAH
jgi:hypothetical protein